MRSRKSNLFVIYRTPRGCIGQIIATDVSMPAVQSSASQPPGLRKAAILLLALGQNAGPLLDRLHEDEIHDVSMAMSELGPVDSDTVNNVIGELVAGLSGAVTLRGSAEHAQRLLSSFLPPEKVAALMEEVHGPAGRSIWEKLANVSPARLAGFLSNEYPQTVAVVLSRISPFSAAAVLSELPADFAYECTQRMLNIDVVSRSILEDIENLLRAEFLSNLGRKARRDNHELLAEIFNSMDRQSERRLGDALKRRAPDSAERIRALMFTFEDLAGLSSTGVQTLMRAIDRNDISLALKGASNEMRELFVSSMSERAAKILGEEMSAMGPVRLKDVEAAQARIVAVAKSLSDSGELALPGADADQELIY